MVLTATNTGNTTVYLSKAVFQADDEDIKEDYFIDSSSSSGFDGPLEPKAVNRQKVVLGPLSEVLREKDIKGEVKMSGYFVDSVNKKYYSGNHVIFDLDNDYFFKATSYMNEDEGNVD